MRLFLQGLNMMKDNIHNMPEEFSKECWATSPRELLSYIRQCGVTDTGDEFLARYEQIAGMLLLKEPAHLTPDGKPIRYDEAAEIYGKKLDEEFSKHEAQNPGKEFSDLWNSFNYVKYDKWLCTYLKIGKTDVLEAAT